MSELREPFLEFYERFIGKYNVRPTPKEIWIAACARQSERIAELEAEVAHANDAAELDGKYAEKLRVEVALLYERVAGLEWFLAQINQYVIPGQSDTKDAALIAFKNKDKQLDTLNAHLILVQKDRDSLLERVSHLESLVEQDDVNSWRLDFLSKENAKLREALSAWYAWDCHAPLSIAPESHQLRLRAGQLMATALTEKAGPSGLAAASKPQTPVPCPLHSQSEPE